MNVGSLTAHVRVEDHGALGDDRISVIRRTLALWCLAMAQRLLRSRIDISIEAK